MNRKPSRLAVAALLATAYAAALLLAVSCGDDSPTHPPAASITGHVLDSAGRPVSQARVVVVYQIEPSSADLDTCTELTTTRRYFRVYPNPAGPQMRMTFAIPEVATGDLRATDRSGRLVRVLASRAFVAGVHAVLWDGNDDTDTPVPNGIYVIHWTETTPDSEFSACARVLLDRTDAAAPNNSYIAITDGEGRFAIPMTSLPIADGGAGYDEVGNFTGNYRVASTVHVCASESTAPGAPSACVVDVPLGNLSQTVTVTVRLP